MRHQSVPASHRMQTQHHQQRTAQDQPRPLHHVRINHRTQAALHRIESGKRRKQNHQQQLVPPKQHMEQQRARPYIDCILGENIDDQQIGGQESAQRPAVAPLNELRDGIDLFPQIKRRKEHGQNDQIPAAHPFIAPGHHADAIAVSGHPQNVFR